MDFVKFLKKEFGFAGGQSAPSSLKSKKPEKNTVSRAPVLSLEERKALPLKRDYKKISILLNDILRALPNEKSKNLGGDHDDVFSEKWLNLHAEAKTAIQKYSGLKRKNLKKAKHLSKNKDFLADSWRFGLGAATAVCLFLTYVLVSYVPQKTAEQIAFIDDVFFGFTNENVFKNNAGGVKQKIENDVPDKNHLDLAKASYIINNSDNFKNEEAIRVAKEDLFGQVAGEMEVNPQLFFDSASLPLPPLPPSPPVGDPSENDFLFTEKYRNFIGRLKEKQLNFSKKMQEYLEEIGK